MLVNKILPTVKRKGSWYGELPLVSVRGKITPAIQNISLIRDDKGNPAYFGNAIHDISQRKNAEQALIESEKKYRNLTEAVPLGIVVTSLGGEIIEANPALIKMFRYKSREEFIKDNAFSHWLNTKINIKEFFKQLLDKNIVKGFEIQFKRKDGTIFWGNITSVKEEAGEGVRITTSLEDITDRKEAEEKLNSQYRQLLSIFDGMDEVVYVADPNTYEILYLNKTGKNNWGDCIGKKCHRFLQKLNSPCSFCSNKHIFGKNLGKTYIWEWHNMINNKWYRCIDKAINWPDGRIVRLEIAVDITERKKSEILLAASEENYRSIFNSANDAIFVHDVATGKILDVNEKVVEMYGFSAKEMHRLNVESISEGVSPYSQKEAAGWMKKASEHGPQLFEWRAKDKKGKLFWVEVNLKLVMIKNTMRILAVVRDITDRKNLEKIKAGLIRDISHGLKTPIAMTEMAISIAEEGVKLKDMNHIRKAQDIAVNNIKKMRRDVDNIMEAFTLDMRRLQENREPVKKVSLTSVMNKIKGEIKYMLDDKMIELSVDICNDADKVLIDSRDLQVLLGNIIVNAIKFTEEGKIFVVARLKDKWIEISIKDTGSGIPPEHIDRVFERFYKHHPAVDGSGLGLAICREIIEMYNGEISIQSQGVGKGTTVTVNLLNKKIK